MILNAMKKRKNSYCHQAYPHILVAAFDFMKIYKQTKNKISEHSNVRFQSVKLLRKLPTGLVNISEYTCFLNAVIQVLNSLPSFRNYVHELSTSDVGIQTFKCLS